MPRNPATTDPDWWTQQLPPPPDFGVGWSQNEFVDANGLAKSGRPNEDRYFTCLYKNAVQMYMVLDGHEGARACEYAMKHLPSVLLHKLDDGEEVLRSIRAAYVNTEDKFFEILDPQICRKVTLQLEISQKAQTSGMALAMYPHQVEEIQRLDEKIKGGTTVVLAVVCNNVLYVSNVGDSRAVYYYLDGGGVLQTTQLSIDHIATNEDEIKRLSELGLDPLQLRRSRRLGMQQNTRSIGDYSIKGGYKDVDIISHASKAPGSAEPFLAAGIDLRNLPPGFLVLMTDGLYTAYEHYINRPSQDLSQYSRSHDINVELGHLIAHEMSRSHDIHYVVRAVVDKVKQLFRDTCRQNRRGDRIDDITLIVRNFGFPMAPPPISTAPAVASHQNPFFPSHLPQSRQVSSPQWAETSREHFPPGPSNVPLSLHDVQAIHTDPKHPQDRIPLRGTSQQLVVEPRIKPSRSTGDLSEPHATAPRNRESDYVNVEKRNSDPDIQAKMGDLSVGSSGAGGVFRLPFQEQLFASRRDDNTLTGPPEPNYPIGRDETLKGMPDSQSDEALMYGPSSPIQQRSQEQPVVTTTPSFSGQSTPEATQPLPINDDQDYDVADIPTLDSDASQSEGEEERSPDGLIKSYVRFINFPMDLSWDSI